MLLDRKMRFTITFAHRILASTIGGPAVSYPSVSNPAADLAEDAHRVSVILKAIGNPWRLRVLCALAEGEKCVGELEEILGINQSALSQHLARLREVALVRTRRDAQKVMYRMESPRLLEILDALCTACGSDGILAQRKAA